MLDFLVQLLSSDAIVSIVNVISLGSCVVKTLTTILAKHHKNSKL